MTAQSRRQRRDLAGFAPPFRMVEALRLAPEAGWTGERLPGRTVLDAAAVAVFRLSARGPVARPARAGTGAAADPRMARRLASVPGSRQTCPGFLP